MPRMLSALLLAWSVVTPTAWAGEPSADAETAAPEAPKPWEQGVSEEQRAIARVAARKAADAYVNKNLKRARELYAEAVAAWNHPKIQYNRSLTLIELGDWVGAHEALHEALRFGPSALRQDNYNEAKRYSLLVAGNVATLQVACTQPGAKVTLDGKALFDAPGEAVRVLTPGEHIIVADKPGYVTTTQKVNAIAGKRQRVDVALAPQMRVRNVYPYHEAIPWTVLGVGIAVAAGGIPLWFAASDSYQTHSARFTAACSQGCFPGALDGTDIPALEARADREFGGSIAMFAIGGTALVAGIVLFIMNQPEQVEEPVGVGTTHVSLSPTPGGGFLNLRF